MTDRLKTVYPTKLLLRSVNIKIRTQWIQRIGLINVLFLYLSITHILCVGKGRAFFAHIKPMLDWEKTDNSYFSKLYTFMPPHYNSKY